MQKFIEAELDQIALILSLFLSYKTSFIFFIIVPYKSNVRFISLLNIFQD